VKYGDSPHRHQQRWGSRSRRRPMVVPDVVALGMQVLFVGFNPGMRSRETRHHFARPSSRLWKTLDGAGFTPCVLRPAEESRLLEHGIDLTNLVDRPTPSADELTSEELRAGARRLRRLASRYRPGWVVILGLLP
jgi:TDG/mug DNA glycosylase family protein